MMKYKVGDKVKIREDLKVQEMNKRVVINVDGNKVIAYCGSKKRRGSLSSRR